MSFDVPGNAEVTSPKSKQPLEEAALAGDIEYLALDTTIALNNLSEEAAHDHWPGVPAHARDYVKKNCSEQFVAVMDQLTQLDPELLADADLAPFEIDTSIRQIELAALNDKATSNDNTLTDEQAGLEQDQAAGAVLGERKDQLSDQIDQTFQEEVDRGGGVDGLVNRVSARLRAMPLGAARQAAVRKLAQVQATLGQMRSVVTKPQERVAFEAILAAGSLNFAASTPAAMLAPVLDEMEASDEISAETKSRLRTIVTGSDAQAALAETIVDENGVPQPRFTRDQPRELRDGVTGYATQSGRQMLDLKPGDHPITMDITGWRGEQVGQLIEVMTVAHDFEAAGLTGYLKSIYHIDFAVIGDAGLTPDELHRMHKMVDCVLGGLETSDGDIIRSGERRGYLRYFARLHNPSGTATGYENSQEQTEQIARELGYKNEDGSINWEILRTIGQFARATYLSGDSDHRALTLHVRKQHPVQFTDN